MFDSAFEILKIISSEGAEARIVGGAVRDHLLGKEIKDIDIAINIPPQESTQLFKKHNIRVIPTGIDYGTITIVFEGKNYEITSLRKDVSTDGRRAVVSYTDDWEEDSDRRDFTINGLYMDVDQRIYDFHNGREDLENKKLRFIGDAEERIKEDYLRILRLCRFYSYLCDFTICEEALNACEKLRSGLDNISEERISDEFKKMFSHSGAHQALRLVEEAGIFELLFKGEINFDFKSIEKYYSDFEVLDYCLGFSLFFDFCDLEQLNKFVKRLRLSNKDKNPLAEIIDNKDLNLDDEYNLKRLIRKEGREKAKKLVEYQLCKSTLDQERFDEINDFIDGFNPPKFPINGDDVKIIEGVKPKEIGKILYQLEEKWEKGNYKLSREELLEALPIS